MSKIFNKTTSSILTEIPKKILHHKENDYLTNFVLYEISQDSCLHFSECAYFIYNPDFNLCKGIAGIKKKELDSLSVTNPWNNPAEFTSIIKDNIYNQTIRSIEFCTLSKEKKIEKIIQEIKKSTKIDYKNLFVWDLPNNNKGIILFQPEIEKNEEDNADIENAVHLLGFCPIPL